MASYISSNANRFYTKLESGYGQVPAIAAANRIPAVKLAVRQQLEAAERKDKTGSRTFGGVPAGSRRRTSFELRTYLTNWSAPADPGYGPLFQAALGAAPLAFDGGAAGSGSTAGTVVFAAAHGLAPGQALTCGGEIRFVAAVVDANTVQLNAPLAAAPASGTALGAALAFFPATDLPSVSIFDYWSPATAVQRILCGVAVDQLRLAVNGDYHEFEFRGLAQELIDSAAFTSGMGQLADFPAEPALGAFDYSIVPGHLGQARLGTAPDRFYTITAASFLVDNQIDARAREFGSALPRAIAPGRRTVSADFDLYEMDDAATQGLYQAAKQQSPVSIMFQLGEQAGQLVGVYLKSVVPDVPEFDDSDNRLQWRFRSARAQGTVDDEVVIALG